MADRSQPARHADARKSPPRQIILTGGSRTRRLTLRPWLMVSGCAAVALLGTWTAAATGFILFRDDFIAGMVRRQAATEYDYENRIAGLKAEIARLQSRQLVEGQVLADRVETLMRRQTSLESHQSVLQSLAGLAKAAGAALPPPAAAPPAGAAPMPSAAVPQPLPEDGDGEPLPLHGGQAMLSTIGPPRQASLVSDPFAAPAKASPLSVATRFDALSASLDRVETAQAHEVAALGAGARERVARIRDALDDIGLDADRIAKSAVPANDAEGGPLVPLPVGAEASPFDVAAYSAQAALATAEAFDHALDKVPLRRPFPTAEITSPFGVRIDPFLGTGAMHTGIDLRETTGASVRATAAGVVTEAGWAGGYGNMVEIDHGNALSTRYGHMSEILVSVGDRIAIGQIIGRVGSTGRSTGPHLHYETRIGGTAVDPMRFLHAGEKISREG